MSFRARHATGRPAEILDTIAEKRNRRRWQKAFLALFDGARCPAWSTPGVVPIFGKAELEIDDWCDFWSRMEELGLGSMTEEEVDNKWVRGGRIRNVHWSVTDKAQRVHDDWFVRLEEKAQNEVHLDAADGL